jgi:hypothetical protein
VCENKQSNVVASLINNIFIFSDWRAHVALIV